MVSKPGDELALAFDAAALPPLRRGMARTFLLHGDGFSKEMDINSASPDAVLPLPFHAMKRYPYAEADVPAQVRKAFEDTESWNTPRGACARSCRSSYRTQRAGPRLR